jgi:hypothetical protein
MCTTMGSSGLRAHFVSSNAHRQVEIHAGVIHARSVNRIRSHLLQSSPVVQRDVGIEQRNFLRGGQRLFLLVRKLFADVRNHHVPAGQDRILRLRSIDLAAAGIADFHFLRARDVAQVLSRARRCCSGECERVNWSRQAWRNSALARIMSEEAAGNRIWESTCAPAGARCSHCRQENGRSICRLLRWGWRRGSFPCPARDPASGHRNRADRIPTHPAPRLRRCPRQTADAGSPGTS